MPSVRQTNFLGGELDPKLWGRTDLETFSRGLRRMRNFFPSQHGAAVSRPGTTFVSEIDFLAGNEETKLITFLYSPELNYVLLFSHLAFRVFADGGYVVDPNHILLDYDTNFFPDNWVVGETVTGGTSGATGVVEEDRGHDEGAGTGTIRLSGVVGTFVLGEALVGSAAGVGLANSGPYSAGEPLVVTSPYSDEDLAALQYAQSGDTLVLTHPSYPPQQLVRNAHDDWQISAISTERVQGYTTDGAAVGCFVDATTLPVASAAEPAREWKYAVAIVYQDETTGAKLETLPFFITQSANDKVGTGAAALPAAFPVYQDKPVKVLMAQAGGTYGFLTLPGNPIANRIYRGQGETYGLVGQVDWLVETFTDIGIAPDYAQQPCNGRNPFKIYDSTGALLRTEEPAAVAWFQDRLCVGGTDERPEWFFTSATGDYYNFDTHDFQLAEDGVTFALASRLRASVRSFYPLNRLLIFTSSSVWSGRGQDGAPLQYNTPDFKLVEEIGASNLHALGVDGCALYVRAKGRGVRALFPGNTSNDSGYVGADVSVLAQHLFKNYGVVDWAYAEDPWGLVWAVRSDGALLSLTFNQESKVWAWARHDSWFASPFDPTRAESALFKNVCVVPEGDEDAVYVVVLRYGGLYLERMASRSAVDGRTALDCSARYQGAPTDTITGLDHLEGAVVYAVAAEASPDENQRFSTFGPFTVASGSITLPEEPDGVFGVLTLDVGLLFVPQLETLDVAEASVRNKQKTVTQIGIEVDQSFGLWAGQDLDHLKESRPRTVAEGYGGVAADTELITLTPKGSWGRTGRAAVEQRAPLPLTVLGITREVDIGG